MKPFRRRRRGRIALSGCGVLSAGAGQARGYCARDSSRGCSSAIPWAVNGWREYPLRDGVASIQPEGNGGRT